MKFFLSIIVVFFGASAFSKVGKERTFTGRHYSETYQEAQKVRPLAREKLYEWPDKICDGWEQTGKVTYNIDKEWRTTGVICEKKTAFGECSSWQFIQEEFFVTKAKAKFYCIEKQYDSDPKPLFKPILR